MSEIIPLTTEHLRILRDDISTVRADVTAVRGEVKAGFDDMRKRLGRVEQSRYQPDDGPLTAAEFKRLAETAKDDLPKGRVISRKQLC